MSQELEQLKRRVEQLEARQSTAPRELDAKEAVSETVEQSEEQEAFDVGGALRFNYAWKDFDSATKTRRGDVGLDLFRLNIDGRQDNILLSVEYRFYSYMNTLHHGWLGYDFGDAGQVQLGSTRVPFGLLPYAAHNFWFGIPYYLGLADDYDAGVKYIDTQGAWNTQVAFFKNAELGDASNLDRYSYDPVTTGTARNQETNTVNARLAYTFGKDSDCSNELGVSGQWGQLYNLDTEDSGNQWAAAGHVDSRCGNWNLQFEGGRYAYSPRNPVGAGSDSVTLGAFGGTYEIAAKGNFAVVNVAYKVPVAWQHVDLLTCYNDFSVLDKDKSGFASSYINTTGCAVGVGPTFTYVDVISGKNAVFFDNGSLAGNGNNDWATRFNINVGYYW